jgi:hypothetical protein
LPSSKAADRSLPNRPVRVNPILSCPSPPASPTCHRRRPTHRRKRGCVGFKDCASFLVVAAIGRR